MKTYRTIQCSDRLPEKIPGERFSKTVFIIRVDGTQEIDWYDFIVKRWFGNYEQVTYWLEEIQLPTEEEIDMEFPVKRGSLSNQHKRTGARWILSKLK